MPTLLSRSLLLCLGLSLLPATGHSAEPISAVSETNAPPIARIALQPYRKGVAAKAAVNGKTGLFWLDTAGGISLLSPEFAKAVGCAPWGQIVGYQMTGNRLEMPRCDGLTLDLSGHVVSVPVAGVYDLASLMAPDAAPIEGLLALDAFAGHTISIDFAGGELRVESPASLAAYVADAREIPIRVLREANGLALAVAVEIDTPQGKVAFELDSGNGGTLLVSKPYAALFGLDPEHAGPQPAQIRIAPGILAQALAFTPELTIDGNLGMPFLKHWILTLDLGEQRAWLQPTRTEPPPGMGAPPILPPPTAK